MVDGSCDHRKRRRYEICVCVRAYMRMLYLMENARTCLLQIKIVCRQAPSSSSECCVLCFIRNRDADCHCHGGGEVKSWHRICVRRSLPARSSNSSCIRLPAGTYFFIIDGVWGGHGMLGPWGAGTSSLQLPQRPRRPKTRCSTCVLAHSAKSKESPPAARSSAAGPPPLPLLIVM